MTLPESWNKNQRIAYYKSKQIKYRLREIFEIHDGGHEQVMKAVMTEYGWTEQQAYIATDFLFRPENTN